MAYSLSLHILKDEGHRLMEEYIALDPVRHGSLKAERTHAYEKLATKLEAQGLPAHFGQMENEGQVKTAIIKLKRMIKSRKRRLGIIRDKSREEYAPNLRELQKMKLNP